MELMDEPNYRKYWDRVLTDTEIRIRANIRNAYCTHNTDQLRSARCMHQDWFSKSCVNELLFELEI